MRYAIAQKKDDDYSALLAGKIRTLLQANRLFVHDEKDPEVVIVIGGDGTFLTAVHQYLDRLERVRFLAVKSGKLGYYCDFEEKDIDRLEDILLSSKPVLHDYELLELEIKQQKYYALNEFTLSGGFKNIQYDIYLDDDLLETFFGEGLLVSTATGSLAYNRSLFGGIVDSKLSSLQLTEIAGVSSNVYHSVKNPIVLSSKRTLRFSPHEGRSGALGCDNLIIGSAPSQDFVIHISPKKLRCFAAECDIFITKLRKTIDL